MTAAKEAGANIVIDGKAVALGIPGGGKQVDVNQPVPGIPLGRGATPDEAANSILLYVYFAGKLIRNVSLTVTFVKPHFPIGLVRLWAHIGSYGRSGDLEAGTLCFVLTTPTLL